MSWGGFKEPERSSCSEWKGEVMDSEDGPDCGRENAGREGKQACLVLIIELGHVLYVSEEQRLEGPMLSHEEVEASLIGHVI